MAGKYGWSAISRPVLPVTSRRRTNVSSLMRTSTIRSDVARPEHRFIHGKVLDPVEQSRSRSWHQEFIEIKSLVDVIVSRGWETGWDPKGKQGRAEGGGWHGQSSTFERRTVSKADVTFRIACTKCGKLSLGVLLDEFAAARCRFLDALA